MRLASRFALIVVTSLATMSNLSQEEEFLQPEEEWLTCDHCGDLFAWLYPVSFVDDNGADKSELVCKGCLYEIMND